MFNAKSNPVVPLRHQIRVKLFALITAVMGVLASGWSVYDIQRESEFIYERTHRTLRENQMAVQARFVQRMNEFFDRVVLEADTNAMIFAPTEEDFGSGSALPFRYKGVWLRYLVQAGGLVKDVLFFDKNTREVAVSRVGLARNQRLVRMAKDMVARPSRLPLASEWVNDPSLGGPTLLVAEKTIIGQDQITGYLVGLLNQDYLVQQLAKESTLAKTALWVVTGPGQGTAQLLANGGGSREALEARPRSRRMGLLETLSPQDGGLLMVKKTVVLEGPLKHLRFEMASFVPSANVAQAVAAYRQRVILYAFWLWLGMALLAWVMAGRFSRNLTEVSGLANAIAEGQEDLHVPHKTGRDEVSLLYQAIGDMRRQLAERQMAVLQAKGLLEGELKRASRLQRQMLPNKLEQYGAYEIATDFEGAKDLSGDMLGVFRTGDGSLAVGCGDISGKGADAAMLMGLLKGVTAAELLRNSGQMRGFGRLRESLSSGENPVRRMVDLAEVMVHLNDVLLDNTGMSGLYATMVLAVFANNGRLLHYSTAGHPPPFVYSHARKVWWQEQASGSPLGLFREVSFSNYTIPLEEGDIVLFFTDGLIEAENGEGERLEEEGVLQMLNGMLPATAEETVALIKREFKGFVGDRPVSDDMALMAIGPQVINELPLATNVVRMPTAQELAAKKEQDEEKPEDKEVVRMSIAQELAAKKDQDEAKPEDKEAVRMPIAQELAAKKEKNEKKPEGKERVS